MKVDLDVFEERFTEEPPRTNDWRPAFARGNARVIHSAAFRRLQGKTQVMGPGEGDFHRTRLTHSLEVTQIGLSLLDGLSLRKDISIPADLKPYLYKGHRHVIAAACEAHDLGHPPFGHGGERALHSVMAKHGGFEGNAQTIRLLVKLEKYMKDRGVNPTRRFLLAVLKYPVSFSDNELESQKCNNPPKCYYDTEKTDIRWALCPFSSADRATFVTLHQVGHKMKPRYKTFDASIMDCADDIAYGTHDLEDIVARRLIDKETLIAEAQEFKKKHGLSKDNRWTIEDFEGLYKGSYTRKNTIGKLVNLLMTNTKLIENKELEHPLLRYNIVIDESLSTFVDFLSKRLTYDLVVERPEIQMLETKGKRIIKRLYEEYKRHPEKLIPHWDEMDTKDPEGAENGSGEKRGVCDYIAGMTDGYAEKIYHRLFTPGHGSSRDEL